MNNLNIEKKDLELLAKIRTAYTELVNYLKELLFNKCILDSPSYADLSRKLGFRYNWIKEKKYSMNQGHFPKKETIDDLYSRLSDTYMNHLSKSYKSIQSKFDILNSLILSAENQIHSNSSSNHVSIKREFFNNLKNILRNYFPNARIFDTDISRLFFKRARALKDSHLKGNYKFRKLELSTLFNFIFKIRTVTAEEFAKKITDVNAIDEDTLDLIRIEVENFIEEFIFANPFEVRYIGDSHTTGTRYFKPEYDLTFSVWFELSKANKQPILIKHAQKLLEYETFGRINRFGQYNKGKVYSLLGLNNMLKKFKELVSFSSYSKIFKTVREYIYLRNLYLPLPGSYHPSWYTKSTIKFHIIMLIIRDLGLDLLNLEPIEAISFKKLHRMDPFTYERHHIFINDKRSIDVNRLALVMHMNHHNHEGKTKLVHSLIRKRIELAFECPQYYKNNLNKWKQRWEEYLERRTFLIQNGIVNFIYKYFTDNDGNNYIFERFFNNIPLDNIEQEIKNLMLDWINKHRPAPILNSQIITKLFCGTPNLITSGFIHHKS